ncbi:MAG: T9SS type A sorting domain-containing protein, partial [Bacteroidota bacterium]
NKQAMTFPNPATGSFTVQGKTGELLETIEIFDASGRIVFQINAAGNNQEELSPNIQSGIYEVRITTQSGTLRTERLVFVQQ